MSEKIRVGMAKLAVAKGPIEIETQALGSCVGIVLYDPYAKIGGISHAMLPDVNCAKESSRDNTGKFVNTAIEILISKMIKKGANKKFIQAKLAGGANMFPDISTEGAMHIGKRNTEAARKMLEELGIEIIAEDIGGSFGRTITLNTETGKLRVRSLSLGVREI